MAKHFLLLHVLGIFGNFRHNSQRTASILRLMINSMETYFTIFVQSFQQQKTIARSTAQTLPKCLSFFTAPPYILVLPGCLICIMRQVAGAAVDDRRSWDTDNKTLRGLFRGGSWSSSEETRKCEEPLVEKSSRSVTRIGRGSGRSRQTGR